MWNICFIKFIRLDEFKNIDSDLRMHRVILSKYILPNIIFADTELSKDGRKKVQKEYEELH